MHMLEKEITFDRFIRGVITLTLFAVGCYFLHSLSTVLLPFFIAWLLAYLLHPIVLFMQHKVRLRNRAISIVATLLLIVGILTAALALIVPPTWHELGRLTDFVIEYVQGTIIETGLAGEVIRLIDDYIDQNTVINFVQNGSFSDTVQYTITQLWSLLAGTYDFAMSVVGLFVVLLYLFFILLDYEKITLGFMSIIPLHRRAFVNGVLSDVEHGMNAYFRGQALIALIVGILFSIGFSIIGLPMAIGLGLFIGLLNMVPYLQLIGFLPAIMLAMLKSADSGMSFWLVMGLILIVFAVVQSIQDFYLTPHIMGKAMGLNPAIILLSLSIWGSLLGVIGLIIALPLTTIIISYYKRYALKDEVSEAEE